ncbi:MAG TPA: glutamate racemase [Stenomitos sp.]
MPNRRERRVASSESSLHPLPIGVFDSGVGGLTVLNALQQRLPQESFLYFGDTAHVPYGTRSQSEIQTLVRQILDWMTQQPIKMAIMACNTSSALALDSVRHEYQIPILGVILPGARAAVRQGQRIGVIATPATVASDCYRRAILEINPEVEVFQVACPEFVPLIEAGRVMHPQTRTIVWERVQPLVEAGIDTLIYGCTHYPHLEPVIRQLLPATINRVDPATYMAVAAARELELLNLNGSHTSPQTQFFVSGEPEQFAFASRQLLGFDPHVEAVRLPGLAVPAPAASEPTSEPRIDEVLA